MPSPKQIYRQGPRLTSQFAVLSGKDREAARRMVLLGYSAREIAEALGITIPHASNYVALWKDELRACRVSEREMARGLMLATYQKAAELVEAAKSARQPIMVAGKPLIGPDGQPVVVETPDFGAMNQFLERMESCASQLGEFVEAVGPTAVARINAESKVEEVRREHDFRVQHPDKIPGLGWASPMMGGPGLPGGGAGTIQVVLMPKTEGALVAERDRLALAAATTSQEEMPMADRMAPNEAGEAQDEPDGGEDLILDGDAGEGLDEPDPTDSVPVPGQAG